MAWITACCLASTGEDLSACLLVCLCDNRILSSCSGCRLFLQANAWSCFVGSTPLVPDCLPNAWVFLMGYVLAYAGFFFLLALVIQRYSAMYQSLVITVITPLTAIMFSFKALMGRYYEALSVWNIFGLLLISAGLVLYRNDDFQIQKYCCRVRTAAGNADSEESTLLRPGGIVIELPLDTGSIQPESQ